MFTSENEFAPLEGEARIPSGCAVSAIIDRSGNRMTGDKIIRSIATMHDRSNGLGGGFAGYGIYPDYKDYYAFHLFFDDRTARKETEDYLAAHFEVVYSSEMKTRKVRGVTGEPLIFRYFLYPLSKRLANSLLDEQQYVVKCVNRINTDIKGAFVFSSGKNMGIFKGVGFPEDIGRFFLLDEEYEGYMWTSHGRYPTNTPGWWGGAHPFGLLDYSVVHNGEISSYDANRRYIEMFGYKCNLQTDTEVITYVIDFLLRVKKLTLEEVAKVISASFWSTIDDKSPEDRRQEIFLRKAFPSLLINGPFSIIFGFEGGLMALNDRLKLRSMVCAEKGDLAFVSSEECGIRVIEPSSIKFLRPRAASPSFIPCAKEWADERHIYTRRLRGRAQPRPVHCVQGVRKAVRQRGAQVRQGPGKDDCRQHQVRKLPQVRLYMPHARVEDSKERRHLQSEL